jgi:adenine/guanine phosphoribosyltransferase-like PRPP-binding protein
MCQDYVKACWEQESEEVKTEIAAEADTQYEAEMGEYRSMNSLPERTADEYHNALTTLDDVGIPLADALSERLGMHVMILAVGPVGSQKGEVRLRS